MACGNSSSLEALAHQDAGKNYRKRCQGTAEHTAVELNAHYGTKCMVVLRFV